MIKYKERVASRREIISPVASRVDILQFFLLSDANVISGDVIVYPQLIRPTRALIHIAPSHGWYINVKQIPY